MQYHPRGREVFAPPILGLCLRDIGILGQGPCAGSMQYCNKNTCFACLKYWNTAPQHLGHWDTGNTVKYSNSPCVLRSSTATASATAAQAGLLQPTTYGFIGYSDRKACRPKPELTKPATREHHDSSTHCGWPTRNNCVAINMHCSAVSECFLYVCA